MNTQKTWLCSLLVCSMLAAPVAAIATMTIYVSQATGVDAGNNGTDIQTPIRSLARAKEVAEDNWQAETDFEILLQGGEVFNGFEPQTSDLLHDYDSLRDTFVFIWDIDRPLRLSTYGPDERAVLQGGAYTHEGGPSNAIAVTQPSSQAVTISNLHIRQFQVGAIFTYKTQNVTITGNRTDRIGTLYFPDEQTPGIYGAGVIYPKNSSNVIVSHNLIENSHNEFETLEALHALYMTRLSDSEISHNIIINASGPPLKFRRSQSNNIHVHDNELYWSGPSTQLEQTQRGWVRYSGDADDGCPYDLLLEDNLFHYPYCWGGDTEDCATAEADLCSISNEGVCGSDACSNPERIQWVNNRFEYDWRRIKSGTPQGFAGAWYDPALDGEGYQVMQTPVGWIIYYYGYSNSQDFLWLASNVVKLGQLQLGVPFEFNMRIGNPGTFDNPAPSSELMIYGTLQVTFDSCTTGTFILSGLDGKKISSVRKLIGIEGTSCTLPTIQ